MERTKPEPDPVRAAIGIPSVAVLTGCFSEAELREAGAESVFGSVSELRAGIRSNPLA